MADTSNSSVVQDSGGTSPEQMTASGFAWEIMPARETMATDKHMFDIDKQSNTLGPTPGSAATPAEETDGVITSTSQGLF